MPDLTFKGGIHPLQSIHHGKDLTSGRVTRTLPPPAQVILPMASFIGAPAKPIVKRGDTVKMGQLVAEAGGFVSAPIHAPVSGKVAAVENRPHSNGKTSLSVVIDNDFADTPWEEIRPYPPVEDMEPQEILAAIQKAGIVGMGGATFPTHVKLSPPPGTKIDTVILNGAECEPYLTADHRLMLEEPGLVVQGLKAVMRALSVSQGVIGVEVNKRDAIESLRSVIGGEKSIRVGLSQGQVPPGRREAADLCHYPAGGALRGPARRGGGGGGQCGHCRRHCPDAADRHAGDPADCHRHRAGSSDAGKSVGAAGDALFGVHRGLRGPDRRGTEGDLRRPTRDLVFWPRPPWRCR